MCGSEGQTLRLPFTTHHCCSQAEGKLNIVMEFASYGSVEGAIKRCQADRSLFTKLTVLSWLQQLGGALQHMHSKQILHRDLKADNVFLADDGSEDGSVRLGDFGISKTLSTYTSLAVTVCGTPFYFSPELIKSQPYREPSDVWALGVILFELLTLKRPFNGDNIAILALNITNGTYDDEALKLSPYPQWLRRLASREGLLHPDPLERLPLPQLLTAISGLDGDDSKALLGFLSDDPSLLAHGRPSLLGDVEAPEAAFGWSSRLRL